MFKHFFNWVRSFVPEALPIGRDEFNAWATRIFELSDVPDNDSTRFALAVMIMHLTATDAKKAIHYFVKTLHKGAANEVANAILVELKAKQQAAATALKTEAANGLKVVQTVANEVVQEVKKVGI
jgi:hypothetical protein